MQEVERVTRVSIDESGERLPLVERLVNGLVTQSSKVSPTALQNIFVKYADDFMLFEAFLGNSNEHFNMVEQMLSYIEQYKNSDEGGKFANSIVKELFDFVGKHAEDRDALTKLLLMIVNTVNVHRLSPQVHAKMIRELTDDVINNMDDPFAMIELMNALLGKSRYWGAPGETLLHNMTKALVHHYKNLNDSMDVQSVMSMLWRKLSFDEQAGYIQSVQQDFYYASEILPAGTIAVDHIGTKQRVFVLVKAHRRDVNLLGTIYKDVGHPHMLFIFDVDNGGEVNASLFALKEKDLRIKPSTPLQRFPYSNVFDSGGCCWNGKPKVKNLAQLDSFPDIFLTNERNMHLYPKPKDVEYRDLLVEMSGKDFDESYLMPTNYKFSNLRGKR
ncbi:hypothetical protein [Paenibacillus sp. GXUN7292]|uniref:hypothetical protein n=1 Tax=Paenibacillus sp. GXUN7292 TaxID=3422499 RepID=UPI003D7D15D5